MNLTKEMKAKKKRTRQERGLRQDHGTRNLTHRRDDADVGEWLEKASKRRDVRHGADEPLKVVEEEVSPWDL